MSEADVMLLATAWDRMDNAAQKVTTSLPFQLSEAVEALDHERFNMRTVVQSILRDTAKAVSP